VRLESADASALKAVGWPNMRTMKAIQIEAFGGPEVLRLKELPVPQAGPGEVLLRVRAASVNPVDYKIRSGTYPPVKADRLPYVLGRDVCGDVESRGAGATAFVEGDALYANFGLERGGYAEYVVVKESEASHKPRTLDAVGAAAVPLAGLTAWQGLFQHGGLKAAQRVLIHGGSGGVGHFAIQFAKAKGAYVITTASGEGIDFVRKLGADEVIDYRNVRFETEVHDLDMVFDLIGGETQDRSWALLKPGGILVSTLGPPSVEKAAAHGVRSAGYRAEARGADLTEIGALVDAGKVKPMVTKTFALKDAAAAQEFVEAQHPLGKVVLTVA
jgi:NADPH:quinone reductase-like Zn-dependent oxidoreductase